MSGTLEIGTILGDRYELESLLGEGGYGVVYRARQTSTGQFVAVKVLQPRRLVGARDREIAIARFEREMQVIGQLSHPNVVRLIDTGRVASNDAIYAVLEYVDGETLSACVKREGRLGVRLVKRLAEQVADALSSAHALGIVHRDLKPQNIMITGEGGLRSAMVLDFGIAAIQEPARDTDYQSLTATGQVHGTPAYMAPEQLRDRTIAPQTDVYALGLVLIECLQGSPVFTGNSYAGIIYRQMSPDPVPLPPWLREHPLGAVLERCVAKEIDDRFPSATDLLDHLEALDVSRELASDPSETGAALVVDGATDSLDGLADTAALPLGGGTATEQPDTDSLGVDDEGLTAPVENVTPERSGRGQLVVVGILVVLGLAIAAWFALGETETETTDDTPTTTRPTDAPTAASATDATPPTPRSDEDEEIDAIPTIEASIGGGSEPLERAAVAARAADVVAVETPGGTAGMIHVRGIDQPYARGTDHLVLESAEVAFYFNTNRRHRTSYRLRNTTDQAVTVAFGLPIKLKCVDEVCEFPPDSEHAVKVDDGEVSCALRGPFGKDRTLLGPDDPEPRVYPADTSSPTAVSAKRFGYEFLHVFEVRFEPGQTREIVDLFPRSGARTEGLVNRLEFSVRGLRTLNAGTSAVLAPLEVSVIFRSPIGPCLATNLPDARIDSRRRIEASVSGWSANDRLAFTWVEPRSLVDLVLPLHPDLVALELDRPRPELAEALATALASKGDVALQTLYDGLMAAYRVTDQTAGFCDSPQLAAFVEGSGLAPLDLGRDRKVGLSDMRESTVLLLRQANAELTARGLEPTPLPPAR